MHSITEQAYISKMLPHLHPKRARKLGITCKDKQAWRSIAREVKRELEERYRTASNEEIIKDMSFNAKPLPITPQAMNFNINDKLIDEIANISYSKREWVKEFRIDLLSRTNKDETRIHQILTENKIRAYQKMPFEARGNVYFANLFLPDQNIIIEITKKKWGRRGLYGKQKKRYENLRRLGYDVIMVIPEDLNTPQGVSELIKQIRQRKF